MHFTISLLHYVVMHNARSLFVPYNRTCAHTCVHSSYYMCGTYHYPLEYFPRKSTKTLLDEKCLWQSSFSGTKHNSFTWCFLPYGL